MAILTFIIGVLMGIFIGAYLLLKKVSETNELFLDKLLINSLLKDALKEGDKKISKKAKK
jgi:hypothetical protein